MTPQEEDPIGDLLQLYPVLHELPDEPRAQFARSAQALHLPAGAKVFDESQACQGFPFVLRGGIRVVKCAPNGRELPLYRVTPGESCIITSSCLLGHSPYNARGITEEETDILLLPRPVFDELLAYPPFRRFVFELFSERLSELMQLVEEVAFRKLDQRLAALLLGKGRVVRTTHQQLADELGSVREIVSRLLKGFADQGYVALGREQIEILDPGGLRQLASDSR
ncbi:MAG: transcriptional regulator [Proteobacteria bacterium]|nr:transcriptional regulator [Pseudomonadota bacterium]